MDTPSEPGDSAGANRILRVAVVAAGILMVIAISGVSLLWLFLKSRPTEPASEAANVVASERAPAPPVKTTAGVAQVEFSPRGFPLRDPKAKTNEIDLSEHYNFILHKNWHDVRGNDLAELPTGLQTLDGTEFDVRGLIQVARKSQVHPPSVTDIPVNQACQRIHFLHAAIGAKNTAKGSVIGKYVVHYVNGDKKEVPLMAKVNIGDWWVPSADDGLEVPVAWTGENAKSRLKGLQVRLLKFTWENPLPKERISMMDVWSEFPVRRLFLRPSRWSDVVWGLIAPRWVAKKVSAR